MQESVVGRFEPFDARVEVGVVDFEVVHTVVELPEGDGDRCFELGDLGRDVFFETIEAAFEHVETFGRELNAAAEVFGDDAGLARDFFDGGIDFGEAGVDRCESGIDRVEPRVMTIQSHVDLREPLPHLIGECYQQLLNVFVHEPIVPRQPKLYSDWRTGRQFGQPQRFSRLRGTREKALDFVVRGAAMRAFGKVIDRLGEPLRERDQRFICLCAHL